MIDRYKQKRTRQISRRKRLLSPASINRELATLRKLLGVAKAYKRILDVPKIERLDGEQPREFVLTPQQEELYLAMAPDDLRDFGILGLDTGVRIAEGLSLEWPQVHLIDDGTRPFDGAPYIHLLGGRTKNSKPRDIPLTSRAVEMLKARGPRSSGFVFQRPDGRPLDPKSLNAKHREVRKLLNDKAKLNLPAEFVPHSFRHTFATRLADEGVDVFTLKDLLGHSSVKMTEKYVHSTNKTKAKAIAKLSGGNAPGVPQVSAKVISGQDQEKRLTN